MVSNSNKKKDSAEARRKRVQYREHREHGEESVRDEAREEGRLIEAMG
jgi:hypothetical protein